MNGIKSQFSLHFKKFSYISKLFYFIKSLLDNYKLQDFITDKKRSLGSLIHGGKTLTNKGLKALII